MEGDFSQEKKKGKKGLVATIIILIVFFLGSLGALYYGYTKYNSLKEDNSKLNTDYEELNKKLNDAKQEAEKDTNKTEEYDNYVSGHDFNIYATGYSVSVIAYKGKMYYVTTDDVSSEGGSTIVLSEDIIKIGLKAGKKGFKYEAETIEEDGTSHTELSWKVCNKNDYCSNYVTDLGINEEEVNRVVIQGAPGATDAKQYTMIVKKDGSVYGFGDIKPEKINLKHKNVDNISVSCDEKGEHCKKLIYKITLKDGTVVKEIEAV